MPLCTSASSTIHNLTGGPVFFHTSCPEPLFSRSYISESVLAHAINDKYNLGVPFNRTQGERDRFNAPFTADELYRWTINLYEKKFIFLMPLLWDSLISNDEKIVQVDETTFLVLRIPGKNAGSRSYIWSYNTCKAAAHPIHLYAFEPGRSGDFPADKLLRFAGYLVTDAYSGYNKVTDVLHAMCWIHARRKFVEALPSDPALAVLSKQYQAIEKIDKIFELESSLQNMNATTRKEEREKCIRPVIDALYEWLEKIESTTPAKSKLSEAIGYCKNNKDALLRFFENGNLPLHNQVSELSMRNVAIGRKNYMFYGSPRGAEAGTCMYSLVETASANQLDPELYLEFLMTHMRGTDFDKSLEYLNSLLPWAEEPQRTCRQARTSRRRQKQPIPRQPPKRR